MHLPISTYGTCYNSEFTYIIWIDYALGLPLGKRDDASRGCALSIDTLWSLWLPIGICSAIITLDNIATKVKGT